MLNFIITYWIEILFSLLVTVITHLYRNFRKYLKKIDTLEKQACLNLKLHIIERYMSARRNGYISMDEKEDVLELYNFLKSFNCSNIAEDIIKEINQIPLK